ncbi:DUF7159 family protein [Mycolicibacterium houstonense]|uniref:DUF7159 family protein n=1 Tax=Mycolicibacterium houstonense TaxID=146021 RepID=UPI0021F30253|nr:hypothetical protein [Mycolicibacterium houstonense]
MDIVLGVAMAPTTVRMVLVEGEKADGVTVDHDVFDVTAGDDSATTSAADQVVAAILGTQESAASGGHHLKSIGVTWTDHSDAAALRDKLSAHGIDDVMLVSEGHAAAALAQAVGRAVGYDTTALLFIDRDTATLSVVQTEDGSVVKVLGRSLHSADAMAVLTEMAAAVDAADSAPQGMFVLGAGVDVASVKAHLENLVSLPISAPDEPEMALARGAALASANAPAFEATTVGLAYSQDPDGTTAGSAYGLAGLATEMAPAGDAPIDGLDLVADDMPLEEERKPFLLVGSALTSVFVVGVVALVISLAVSIRPTVDQRPAPAQGAVVPSAPAKLPAPAPEAQPAQPAAPPPAPPPETIKAPVPVVQEAPAPAPQAPPRTVYVEQPAAVPDPPQAPAPAPEAPPPAPAPVAPAPVLPAPAPVYQPPAPYVPPLVVLPPAPRLPNIFRPPWEPPQRQEPQRPPWQPPRYEPETPRWPGSGSDDDWGPSGPSSGWNPGGSGSGNWNPGRSGGSDDWNPGRGSGDWNPGGSRGGSDGDGGSLWPFPFGGGH